MKKDRTTAKTGLWKSPVSRRAFLAGTSAVALAGAAMGCTPQMPDTGSDGGTGQADGGSDSSPFANFQEASGALNPQDDSYTSFTTDYSALFEPLTVRGMTMKNRIVKCSAGSDMLLGATDLPDNCLAFYEAFLKGGVGMVVFESGFNINPPEEPGFGLPLRDPEDVAIWKVFADLCHSYDTPCSAQLRGDFSQMSSSKANPSPLDDNDASFPAMTTEQVQTFIGRIVNAAGLLHDAGFDAAELNCSVSTTFGSFLSRYWNNERDDEYGPQSIENRARIVTECIEGIRERCGEDFAIQVLFNGVEENFTGLRDSSSCLRVSEAIQLAQLFEKAGADTLQVRSSTYGNHATAFMTDLLHVPVSGYNGLGSVIDFSQHLDGAALGQFDGAASLLEVAKQIKKAVSIPVGFVGCADPRLAPDLLNDAIANGEIDLLFMTRPLMADPELPNKLMEGRRDDVAPCTHCLTCFASLNRGTPMFCRTNPAITRALSEEMPEGYDPTPAATAKNVMVIGGGPAGMEAARIAAQRGHSVSLYEKNGALGGMMDFASAIKGSHEKIADYTAWLQKQVADAGVEVVTSTEVDADLVAEKAPDTVVVACGGVRPALDFPGSDSPKVVSIQDYPTTTFGDRVVVLGGGLQAIDFAIWLVKQGIKVTVVHEGPEVDLGKHSPCWPKAHNLSWLSAQGTQFFNEAAITGIDDNGVSITTSYGVNFVLPADNVVACLDMQPNASFADTLAGNYEVVVVGDALEPQTIAHASATGNVAARKI